MEGISGNQLDFSLIFYDTLKQVLTSNTKLSGFGRKYTQDLLEYSFSGNH